MTIVLAAVAVPKSALKMPLKVRLKFVLKLMNSCAWSAATALIPVKWGQLQTRLVTHPPKRAKSRVNPNPELILMPVPDARTAL